MGLKITYTGALARVNQENLAALSLDEDNTLHTPSGADLYAETSHDEHAENVSIHVACDIEELVTAGVIEFPDGLGVAAIGEPDSVEDFGGITLVVTAPTEPGKTSWGIGVTSGWEDIDGYLPLEAEIPDDPEDRARMAVSTLADAVVARVNGMLGSLSERA
ncbi:MAG: hypothetical protein JHD16_00410 [Solirubrobacteraceae bacterium]|nr:hypothetical protein [Solirubrobacteraceae bacterium]